MIICNSLIDKKIDSLMKFCWPTILGDKPALSSAQEFLENFR